MRLKLPLSSAGLHPLEHVLGLTAFTAGAVDVLSFAALGGVFASAMTGNMALLALYTARGNWHPAFASLVCLAGFALGAAVAAWFAHGRQAPRALAVLLRAEAVLLALFIPLLAWLGPPGGRLLTYLPILPLSTAMGVQIIIGRKLNLANVPTVVFTSTLASAVTALADAARAGHFVLPADARRQAMALAAYLAGAFVSALLAGFIPFLAPWLPLFSTAAAIFRHRGACYPSGPAATP